MWNKFKKFIRDLVCEHRSTSTLHHHDRPDVVKCLDCGANTTPPKSAQDSMDSGSVKVYGWYSK